MVPRADPTDILRETSRTFYLSIIKLPSGLREAVMSAYLTLRGIDEIEDHPRLGKPVKIQLLRNISFYCQELAAGRADGLYTAIEAYLDDLPEVTRRLSEWIALAPRTIAPAIWEANASMALRMAYWVDRDWQIHTKTDLDDYTFSVAGAVGLLLSDLWNWYDGTTTHKGDAVGFGRGLQAVNILRNRAEDLARGVDFFPDGWNETEVRLYAIYNLSLADAYVGSLPHGHVRDFCRLPLSLAYATLDALSRGESKLSRADVLDIAGQEESTSLNVLDTSGKEFRRRIH
jgi:farnesyl-diphosphate farnesyltransferase